MQAWRCEEGRFGDMLDELRTSTPSKKLLKRICRGHIIVIVVVIGIVIVIIIVIVIAIGIGTVIVIVIAIGIGIVRRGTPARPARSI